MDDYQRRTVITAAIAFLVGWAIGLFVFGWILTPVEYTGAGPQHLFDEDQDQYLIALADLYAFDNNGTRVQQALGDWNDAPAAICQLAGESVDPAQAARLNSLAAALNGLGCTGPGVPGLPGAAEPTEDGGGLGQVLLICGLIVILGALLAGIYLAWRQRGLRSMGELEQVTYGTAPLPGTGRQAMTDVDQAVTPIARFQTTYARGHDTYDESFSIENASGDFLGECGLSISETLGTDSPKNVTAFEVWLFDKNDIRTVTKVIMSDHAFFDEAIKAKLAPKGEPVLARPNETIVLETASLIVNAEITELEYGMGSLPPQSFFERFTLELSAWAKEGEHDEPDVQGRIDEMLDF